MSPVRLDAAEDPAWLERFHRGERHTIERCYREHFGLVRDVVRRFVSGVDQETVIHEVFYRLLSDKEARQGFRGGSFVGWLTVVARNQALEFLRRTSREVCVEPSAANELLEDRSYSPNEESDARVLIEHFRRDCLPRKWDRVFEARFIQQLDQRQAAKALGMNRTTLAYQEFRIRQLLRRFLERGERP